MKYYTSKFTKKLFVLFLVGYVSFCFSQERITFIPIDEPDPSTFKYKEFNSLSLILTDQIRVTYNASDKFKTKVYDEELFKNQSYKVKEFFNFGTDERISNDKQMIRFVSIASVMDQKLEDLANAMTGRKQRLVDRQHFFQIRALLRGYYGDHIGDEWKHFVQYYPQEDAIRKFNADSVIRVSISFFPEDYINYEGQTYKHADILLIQKEGRGYVYISCLYTDKAKRKMRKYWREIEGMLRYEDD